MSKFKDLTGQKFGRLTVIKKSGKTKWGNIKWFCVCDCGNCCTIPGGALNKGNTKSCGCLSIEIATKHGYARDNAHHPLYYVWRNMKNRCMNPKNKDFKQYGLRGISVCQEWVDDPKEFINWCLNNGWKNGLELNRVDNNSGYYPVNCNFVTHTQNCRNTRLLNSTNTSGFRGVNKQGNRYVSKVYMNGRSLHIGCFSSPIIAAIARDFTVIQTGSIAPLNFPELKKAIKKC